jgi:hypothetical protein
MGLLAPKNQVIGTSGTRMVLPTLGTTDKYFLAAENQVIGITCTGLVVPPPPLKISPRNNPNFQLMDLLNHLES